MNALPSRPMGHRRSRRGPAPRQNAPMHALDTHRPILEALAYRMLGSAAEAEDVVQDTFVRALTRPPATDRPVRPWLVRVTCNLARDRLRKRKVRAYHGPWLPEPMAAPPMDPAADPELNLRLAQTATLAWLVAAEALTPEQRAVILLREVLDWSVTEVGAAIDRSPGAVRSLHLRARRALHGAPTPTPDPDALRAHQDALQALIDGLLAGDQAALERLLTDDVVLTSDGGGEVHAIGKHLVGPARVARVALALAAKSAEHLEMRVALINGLPALLERTAPHRSPRWPTTSLTSVVLGPDGRIARVFNVVAPSKLTQVGLD